MQLEGAEKALAVGRQRAGVATQLNSHSFLPMSTASPLTFITPAMDCSPPRKPFMVLRDVALLLGASARIVLLCVWLQPAYNTNKVQSLLPTRREWRSTLVHLLSIILERVLGQSCDPEGRGDRRNSQGNTTDEGFVTFRTNRLQVSWEMQSFFSLLLKSFILTALNWHALYDNITKKTQGKGVQTSIEEEFGFLDRNNENTIRIMSLTIIMSGPRKGDRCTSGLLFTTVNMQQPRRPQRWATQ